VFDADEFGEPGLEHFLPSVSAGVLPFSVARTAAHGSFGIDGQDAARPGKSLPRTAAGRAAHSCKSGDLAMFGPRQDSRPSFLRKRLGHSSGSAGDAASVSLAGTPGILPAKIR
jgi:hypothetical protein